MKKLLACMLVCVLGCAAPMAPGRPADGLAGKEEGGAASTQVGTGSGSGGTGASSGVAPDGAVEAPPPDRDTILMQERHDSTAQDLSDAGGHEPPPRDASVPPAPTPAPEVYGGGADRAAPRRERESKKSADFGGGGGAATRSAPDTSVASPTSPGPAPAPRVFAVAAPAMRAGRHDDNKSYNRFLAFLADNRTPYPVDVSERLVLRTLDKDGKSLPGCQLEVKGLDGKPLTKLTTYADGRSQFFPAADGPKEAKDYTVVARCAGETKNGQLGRTGRREVELRFGKARELPRRVPVDIAIVFDTTGSMGSQIDRLKKTLQAIHFQLTQLPMQPDVRFGLVAYRDQGEDYVTRVTNFTGDVALFQRAVDALEADGGGDTPEDLQAAFEQAMHTLSWRPDAVRVGFVIADAIPHTDYGQAYTYREAMRESLSRGIKWTMVGAGGLPRQGEAIFRQIAQFTMGEYVFVTESGGGDTEGGVAEASHHVGTNYTQENLDQAMLRIVKRELSYLTDSPRDFDDTIHVTGTAPRDQILKPAVEEVLRQLVDYSSLRLAAATPVAIVPVACSDKKSGDVCGYLTDQLMLSASRNPTFKVVERDLQALSAEIKLQLTDLFDVKDAVPIGQMIGAEALVVAKLVVTASGADLFAKLVRVETGEVLAVAKVDIAKAAMGLN